LSARYSRRCSSGAQPDFCEVDPRAREMLFACEKPWQFWDLRGARCAKSPDRPMGVRATATARGIDVSGRKGVGRGAYSRAADRSGFGRIAGRAGHVCARRTPRCRVRTRAPPACGVTRFPAARVGFVSAGAGDGSAWQIFGPQDFHGGVLRTQFFAAGRGRAARRAAGERRRARPGAGHGGGERRRAGSRRPGAAGPEFVADRVAALALHAEQPACSARRRRRNPRRSALRSAWCRGSTSRTTCASRRR